MDSKLKIVIVGGGIAGISCLDTLLSEHKWMDTHLASITLISETRVIKKVVNHVTRGKNLESFDIEAGDVGRFYPLDGPEFFNFEFVAGNVISIDSKNRLIEVRVSPDKSAHREIRYDILCLANGATPKSLETDILAQEELAKRILTVRDTTSVNNLKEKIAGVERVAIIGNGGISLELVHNLTECDIIWVIRDEFIGHPFLDPAASKFLLEAHSREGTAYKSSSRGLEAYSIVDYTTHKSNLGPALGPHWLDGMSLTGVRGVAGRLEIFTKAEVDRVSFNSAEQHQLRIFLQDLRKIDVDIIVLAIGVVPSKIRFISGGPEISLNDGGVLIDPEMRTSIRNIYAAGDSASCERWPPSTLWFQMRLWTQARQMGHYCAKCISAHILGHDPTIYANFECFTHVTSFLGFKIVLLGRYNAQNLPITDQKLELIARVRCGKDYIKVILMENRVIGAILVGETSLEETIENLIYDQIDIGDIKHQLLDDTIDIEDYFD